MDLHGLAPMVVDKVALIRSAKENDGKDKLRQKGESVESLDFVPLFIFIYLYIYLHVGS